MFDKNQCKKCMYHSTMGTETHCGYSLKTKKTCLKHNGKDIRGDNPKKCKLFEPFWFDK